jgi:plasmid stabilization system protein ParE
MPFTIHYSHLAKEELADLLRYVSGKFGLKSAEKVKKHFVQIIEQISLNPYQFPYFNKPKKIRKCVLSSQTTLYYSVTNTHIELISFRNNFKNPKTLNI